MDRKPDYDYDLENRDEFIYCFKSMQMTMHYIACEKGWYGMHGEDVPDFGVLVANVHAELSEAWEYYRKGNPVDDKIPYSGIEAELADVIIRVMDTAEALRLDVASALVAKAEYNKTREYRHGGKVC